MIEKMSTNELDLGTVVSKLNEVIDTLNQYEKDGVWTAKEFRERLKNQLYDSYVSKIKQPQ